MFKLSPFLLHVFLVPIALVPSASAGGQQTAPQHAPTSPTNQKRPHSEQEQITSPSAKAPESVQAHESVQAQELWFGVMKTRTRQFRFVLQLNLKKQPSQGQLISLDEGGQSFSLSNVKRSGDKFTFLLPLTNASFASTLNEEGTTANGTWTQRGHDIPLSFSRVASVPIQQVKHQLTGTLNALVQKIEASFVELETGEIFFNSVTQNAGGFIANKKIQPGGRFSTIRSMNPKSCLSSSSASRNAGRWKTNPRASKNDGVA